MIKENVKIDTGNIVTYRRSKKTNDILYFSHANGFCGQAYTDLLNKIDNSYEVITYDMRGHGETDLIADSNKLKSWYTFRDDLEQLVEKHKEPVTLSGHSMGGTASLLLALSKPKLVKKLILIDPVILPLRYIISYKLLQIVNLAHLASPLSKNALIRRNLWNSEAEAYEYFSSKPLFKNISEKIITDYVQYGLKKNEQNKYVLKCDPRWESACFKLTSHEVWFDLKKINIPIKIILTPNSVVCNETSQNRIKKLNPQTKICFIYETSHMLPLEKTEVVASEINNFLA
jgi:pimeloyl-ACP methyl ester carboxylesterase